MNHTETLEKLCEIVGRRLEKVAGQMERDEGKLTAEDADYLDRLTHTLKSIKTTLAMEGYGRSERQDAMGRFTSNDGYRGDESYRGGMSREGGSYDGGSMRGSYHGDAREQLEQMMRNTGDERVRRAIADAMRNM